MSTFELASPVPETQAPAPRLRLALTFPFPVGRANGGARTCRDIAGALVQLGVDVTLLSVSTGPLTRFPRPRIDERQLTFALEDLEHRRVRHVRVAQHLLHWCLDGLPMRAAVQRLHAERRVDFLLSSFHESIFLPALARRLGLRFGFLAQWQSYAHALDPGRCRSWIRNRVIAAHRSAEVIFAASSFTKRELIDVVGVDERRIVLCPLGLEPKFFTVPRSEPTKASNLLFFGRLVASKGVGDTLRALAELDRQNVKDWRLRLVGEGDQGWVRELASELGIADRVEVRGPVRDQALLDELAWAHVAVLPSHFEAFGYVFVEAQAAGLPVVAYAAGSVPELVRDGEAGWLAPVHDVKALAACLAIPLGDAPAAYRAGLVGRQRAAQFTFENAARTILAGFRQLS